MGITWMLVKLWLVKNPGILVLLAVEKVNTDGRRGDSLEVAALFVKRILWEEVHLGPKILHGEPN